MTGLVRRVLTAQVVSLLVLVASGCTSIQKSYFIGQSNEIPQSQAVDWGNVFKMQITNCSWQGSDLVVDLKMTFNGNDPGVPGVVPVFQLKTSDDKHFNPSNGADVDERLVGTNYNPGSSVNVTLRFPAPRGDYKLLVENGGQRLPSWGGLFPASGPVVYVWLIQPTGG